MNLAKQLETLTAQCHRLKGRQDSQIATLKEMGLNSVAEAKAKLEELNKEIADLESTITEQYTKFMADYGDVLASLGS